MKRKKKENQIILKINIGSMFNKKTICSKPFEVAQRRVVVPALMKRSCLKKNKNKINITQHTTIHNQHETTPTNEITTTNKK